MVVKLSSHLTWKRLQLLMGDLTTLQAINGWLTCLYLLSAQDKHLSLGVLTNTISLPTLHFHKGSRLPLGTQTFVGLKRPPSTAVVMRHRGIQRGVGSPLPRRGYSCWAPEQGWWGAGALPRGADQGARWLLPSEMWGPQEASWGSRKWHCPSTGLYSKRLHYSCPGKQVANKPSVYWGFAFFFFFSNFCQWWEVRAREKPAVLAWFGSYKKHIKDSLQSVKVFIFEAASFLI